jgi:hypothetical protein
MVTKIIVLLGVAEENVKVIFLDNQNIFFT